MNFNKYARPKPAKPPLNDWIESVQVILLSEYLKSHADIKLCHDNGVPCLSFNPGISKADLANGRWQIAQIAEGLLLDAAADLTELISKGKLIVHQSQHDSSSFVIAKNFTGPSTTL